jgi:HAD superfamily hydrolase (TIGR01490 family)
MGRRAAFFDLDKTVLSKSSTLAFGPTFYRAGLVDRVAVARGAYAQFVYTRAGADAARMERMRAYLAAVSTGWEVSQVQHAVSDALDQVITPLVYAESRRLISDHQRAGDHVVIVSSSGSDVVDPVATLLGVDDVIATRMTVQDGRYTGEIDEYVYGPGKVTAMHRLAEAQDYDLLECYAYSDSITDLPMLEAVGRPYAVNPDRRLRRVARAKDWPVLRFHQYPAAH